MHRHQLCCDDKIKAIMRCDHNFQPVRLLREASSESIVPIEHLSVDRPLVFGCMGALSGMDKEV